MRLFYLLQKHSDDVGPVGVGKLKAWNFDTPRSVDFSVSIVALIAAAGIASVITPGTEYLHVFSL